ncbi:hypothetical protein DIPPA_19014 [Diplonema papillatum]|nr:hypothetical protein DIPPA_19014 [Diplonema papillatum]
MLRTHDAPPVSTPEQVVFYRKLDTGDGNDFELAPGAAVTLAWAFGSGSVTLDTWSKHSQAGTVPVVLEAQSRCYVRALTPETDGDGVSTGLIIGIVAGVVVLALLIVGAVAWTRRRRTGSDEEMGIDEFMNTLHATEFDDFLLTTNQFSEMEDFDDTKDGIGFGLSRHLQL